MTFKTLYVAQFGHDVWFPFGRLDADAEKSYYRFQYTHGGLNAAQDGRFAPLPSFPDLDRVYESSELFSFFANRTMGAGRPDFHEYLKMIGLGPHATPVDQLEASGGRKATDHFEIFPAPCLDDDGYWVFRCFLDHCAFADVMASKNLNDDLSLAIIIDGRPDRIDVQAQTSDHVVIGYLPAYFAREFAFTMVDIDNYRASVSLVNHPPAPRSHRAQVEVRLKWDNDRIPLTWPEYTVVPFVYGA